MRDYKSNRTKDLDLVLARPSAGPDSPPVTMIDLADRWGVRLDGDQQTTLQHLPLILEAPAGNVLLALEAKACMTAHIKALPRLFDELTSSYSTVHGDTERALAVGFVMINAADTFLSTDRNKANTTEHPPVISQHSQPLWANRAVEKVTQELRRRGNLHEQGFDALGVVVVDMRNDGTPVQIVTDPPAPRPNDVFAYDRMVSRIAQLYDTSFDRL
jgi:hypothetical protein